MKNIFSFNFLQDFLPKKMFCLLWIFILFSSKFLFSQTVDNLAEHAVSLYRSLLVYTTSASDPNNKNCFAAQTVLYNRSKKDLHVSAYLISNKLLNINNSIFEKQIKAGHTSVWTWSFVPISEITRTVVTGKIQIDKQPIYDLFIAAHGRDSITNFPLPKCHLITNTAEIIATYTPYTEEVLSLLQLAKKIKKDITIVERGVSRFVIFIDSLPSPTENCTNLLNFWHTAGNLPPVQLELVEAIEDLQRCIRIQSGAFLPIVTKKPGSPAIILKRSNSINTSQKIYDAYHLQIKNDSILIEAPTFDGLRNGIYGFLTDYLGCHWFQPGELGEEIPISPDQTIKVPFADEVRGSPWFSVGGISWNSDPLWERRNRAFINRARMNFGHSWANYINEREFPYEKFPQYYARDRNGKIRKVEKKDENWTSTNFCSTDTNVLEIVAKKINAFFDANPDAIVASLDPNDYAPMCLCERCTALDKKYGVETKDGTNVSDRLIHFSNEIYARLKPEYRSKYLGILIYGYQMELPKKAKPHDHHAGIICNFPPRYDHSRPWNDPTSPWNKAFYNLVTGWGKILSQLGYYDYYGHYYYFGPFGVIHKMKEDLPAFYELGGTFLMLENEPVFAAQGINHYISARLSWDIKVNVDALLEEFFSLYYGPVREPMRKFWLTAERYFALERPGTRTETRVALRPEFWDELSEYMREAQKIASSLPPEQKRFADRVKFNADGFEYGKIVFEYEYKYKWGNVSSPTLDSIVQLAAGKNKQSAIAYLKANKTKLDEIKSRYYEKSPYWPPFLPSWSWFDVDAALKELQENK